MENYSRLPDPHPPLPKGNTLDWKDHLRRKVERGEMTKAKYKKFTDRQRIRRISKYMYGLNEL